MDVIKPVLVFKMQKNTIRLHSCPKQYTYDQDKACSPTETVQRFHVGLEAPVVFDCRMKPWYTDVLEVDPATKALVDEKISSIIPASYR